jgi:hypothetical protein
VFDFAIPADMGRRPDARANVDLANPQARGLIALLAKRRVLVDPTLTVFKNMLLLSDLEEVQKHSDNDKVPERLRTYWDGYRRGQGLAPGTRDRRTKEFEKYQELVGLLHKAGVPLLVGTDAPEPYCPPGYALHQEMELMVASGMTPVAVLQAATINNARALKQDARLGSVAAGKVADLVILDADPTADIRNTRKIARIIHGGIACDPAKVLQYVPARLSGSATKVGEPVPIQPLQFSRDFTHQGDKNARVIECHSAESGNGRPNPWATATNVQRDEQVYRPAQTVLRGHSPARNPNG